MRALHERVAAALDGAGELTGAALVDHVRRVHAEDAELVREIERLMGADVPGVLDAGIGEAARAAAESVLSAGAEAGSEEAPARIGAYRVVREVGRGGMGVVYEAEQAEPRRRVAVKVIRALTASGAARLRREAATMGRLKHPGIAQIYEAGVDPAAGPYIVMEFVEGTSLLEYAAARGLDEGSRLELLAQVCDAVHAAHQRAIIHRDLKPSNVLVETLPDGRACPKVLDFGVARVSEAGEEGGGVTMALDPARIVGTLGYMSPEAIEPPPEGVDIRADVYALGVMLYELVSGRTPIDLGGVSLTEAAHRVMTTEPTPLESLAAHAKGDLSLIAATAVAKNREERYSSAAALGADLRRLLRHEPIAARPPTLMYQLRKLARRNKGLTIGVGAAVVALGVGAVAATVSAVSEHRALGRAEAALDVAERRIYAASLAGAARAIAQSDSSGAMASLREAPEHLRGWEWSHLAARASGSVEIAPTVKGVAFPISVTDRGALVVLYDEDLALVEPGTWRVLKRVSVGGVPRQVASSFDGRLHAISRAGLLRVFSSELDELWTLEGVHRLERGAFSGDGEMIVQVDGGHRTAILDAERGTARGSFATIAPPGRGAFFGHEPGVWYESGFAQRLVARRRADGATVWESTLSGIWRMANGVGPVLLDGTRVVRIDPATGAERQSFDARGANVGTVSGDPETGLLASCDGLGTVSLWSTGTGRRLHSLMGQTRASETVFAPGGRLASGTSDGALRRWEAHAAAYRTIAAPPERVSVSRLALGAGRVIAIGWGSVMGWDTTTGAPAFAAYLGRMAGTPLVAVEPGGARALLLGWRRGAVLVRTADGLVEREFPNASAPAGGARSWAQAIWTPQGVLLVDGAGSMVLDTRDGTTRGVELPACVSVCSDALGALLGGADGAVRRWDAATGVGVLDTRHAEAVTALATGPGGMLVSGDGSGVLVIRSAAGVVTSRVPGRVSAVAVSHDGERVAACTPGAVHMVDAARGDVVLSMEGPAQAFEAGFDASEGSLEVAGAPPLTVYSTGFGAGSRDWQLVQDGAAFAAEQYRAQQRQLVEDVIARIENAGLKGLVKDAALRAARVWQHPVPMVNSEAWAVAIVSESPRGEAERAVRAMERVCAEHPDASLTNTLGFCLYRAGRYEDALAAFTRSDAMAGGMTDLGPSNAAGMAMALKRLGREDESRAWLERARALGQPSADDRLLFGEAKETVEGSR